MSERYTDSFDLSASDTASRQQWAVENGISADQVQPGMFEGMGYTLLATPNRGIWAAAKGVGILANAATIAAEKLTGSDSSASDANFAWIDKHIGSSVDALTPNALQTGKATQIVDGLLGGLAPLALGPEAGVTSMLASTQVETGTQLMEHGATPGTALAAGSVATAANAVGFKIPIVGKTLATRMASGAAGNVAVGAGSAAAIHEVLRANGNTDLADQYNWADPEQRALDTLMGIGFGGFEHLTAPKLTTAEKDAVLTLRNAKHFQQDSAPGVPADMASSVKHQAAMEQALTQLMTDQPVEVADQLQGAAFHGKPVDETQAKAVAEAIQEIKPDGMDGLAEFQPQPKPIDLFPANDLAAVDVPDQVRGSLSDAYKQAAEVKPVFDATVRDIARQIGTPHEPMIPSTLKGVDRAAEKVMADYAGDTGKLKDIVRGTIVVDSLDQAHQALALLQHRFGEFTKYRNTLDHTVETLDGYRDINTNVMVNGHVSELQINFPEMLKAKDAMHGLYEERRVIAAKDHPTAEELAHVAKLNEKMKASYAAAWDAALSRLNSASEIKVPSSKAQDNLTGRPSGAGTSNARTSAPPAPSGKAATGTPSTSQNTGYFPNTGSDISAPPTARSVAQGDSSQKTAESPDIIAARQLAAEQPNTQVLGGFDADGNPQYRPIHEVLAEIEAEHATAVTEAQAYDVAANCFLKRGD